MPVGSVGFAAEFGLGVSSIGLGKAILQEAGIDLFNYATDDIIGKQFEKIVVFGAEKLQSKYPNLSEQQAQALVGMSILSGFIAKDGLEAFHNLSNMLAHKPRLAIAGAGVGHLGEAQATPEISSKWYSKENQDHGVSVFSKQGEDLGGGNKNHVPLKYQLSKWEVKPAKNSASPEVYLGPKGKIYKDPTQKIGNKEIWYSKDNAGHSGQNQGLPPSAYKLFVFKDKAFKWIADVDATGKVIEGKTKGKSGKEIKVKECWKVK